MHRIDGPGATVDNKFTEGDPVGGIPATVVTDTWLTDLQENVCKVIEGASIALVKGSSNQLKDAIAAMIASGSLDLLNTVRTGVASAATVNLTTAAPNTRHINITGTTTISAFTVASGKCYFVRFDAALTLTNGASLVTQSGGNIITAAGDTCMIRATAANVVEILSYTPGVPQEIGYRQTYQNVTASRALATTYTNNTGRPIVAIVSMTANASAGADTFVALVDTDVVYDLVELDSNFSYSFFLFIPAGSTYRCNSTIAPTIRRWMEIRT